MGDPVELERRQIVAHILFALFVWNLLGAVF